MPYTGPDNLLTTEVVTRDLPSELSRGIGSRTLLKVTPVNGDRTDNYRERDSWRQDANCTEADGEEFFPEDNESQLAVIAKYCLGCKALMACRYDDAEINAKLNSDQIWGVFGGLTELERRRQARLIGQLPDEKGVILYPSTYRNSHLKKPKAVVVIDESPEEITSEEPLPEPEIIETPQAEQETPSDEEKVDLTDKIAVVDLADEFGVGLGKLEYLTRKHEIPRTVHRVGRAKRAYISIDDAVKIVDLVEDTVEIDKSEIIALQDLAVEVNLSRARLDDWVSRLNIVTKSLSLDDEAPRLYINLDDVEKLKEKLFEIDDEFLSEVVAISDLAEELGVRISSVHQRITRNGIKKTIKRRAAGSKKAFVSKADAEIIRASFESQAA